MLLFILVRHALWVGLVLLPRSGRFCGCLKMALRTHPHGPRVSPPLVLLLDIHNGLMAKYDCKDSVPPPDQSGERARAGRNSQDGVSQQQEASTLFVPQLNKLHEAFHVRGQDASNLPTTKLHEAFQDASNLPTIPLQKMSPFRYSTTFGRSKTLRRHLPCPAVPSSFACARSSAS